MTPDSLRRWFRQWAARKYDGSGARRPGRSGKPPAIRELVVRWGAIAAMDFFHVEVLTLRGPARYAVLFVIDLKTRAVEIAGIVRELYEEWMVQVARNLTDAVDGFLLGKKRLIVDRDSPRCPPR